MVNNSVTISSEEIKAPIIYLKAVASFSTNIAAFYYSLDNKEYIKPGNQLDMKFQLSIFTGNKFCLFNYATVSTGG